MTSHKKPTPRPTRDWDSIAAGVFLGACAIGLMWTSGDVAGPVKTFATLGVFLLVAAAVGSGLRRRGHSGDSRSFSNEDGFGPE